MPLTANYRIEEGVLMAIRSKRAFEVIGSLSLVRVFDALDLGSPVGRHSKLFHVIDESDDEVCFVAR